MKGSSQGVAIFQVTAVLAMCVALGLAGLFFFFPPHELFEKSYLEQAGIIDLARRAKMVRASIGLPELDQSAVEVFRTVQAKRIERHLLNLLTPQGLSLAQWQSLVQSGTEPSVLEACYRSDPEGSGRPYMRRDDAPPDALAQLSESLHRAGVHFSRYTGYEGEKQAREYIRSQLSALDLEIIEHPFDVPTPIDGGARLVAETSSGDRVVCELLCMMPNGARTSALPTDGIRGTLIDGGNGSLHALKGKTIEGNIVVVDMGSRTYWENVFRLGGRAVIFRSNAPTNRDDTKLLHLFASANYPRFYVPQDTVLQTLYGREVRLWGHMRWENREAVTLIARVPGRKPQAGAIMVTAHYDSSSVVPAHAPGADQASSAASLLEIGRVLKQHPPTRDVLLAFFGGHHQAMVGSRTLLDDWRCDKLSFFPRLSEAQRHRSDKRFQEDPRLTTALLLEHEANLTFFHQVLRKLTEDRPIGLSEAGHHHRQQLAQQVSVALSRRVNELIADEDSSKLLLVRQREVEQRLMAADRERFLDMNRFMINPGRETLRELVLPQFMQRALKDQLGQTVNEIELIVTQLQRRRHAVQWLNRHKPSLVFALGLSSHGEQLNLQSHGYFMWATQTAGFHPENPFWSKLGKAPMSWAALTEQIDRRFRNPGEKRMFGTFYESRVSDAGPAGVVGYYATEAAAFNIWDFLAVNVGSTADFRLWHNTPFDTFSRMDTANLTRQARYLATALWKCAQETALGTTHWENNSVYHRYCGHVLALDQRRESVPSTPVPHAFVRLRRGARPIAGVLAAPIAMTDYRGRFEMPCILRQPRADRTNPPLTAYAVDEEGNIIRALDQNQADLYPTKLKSAPNVVEPRFVTFACRAITITDFTDPRFLVPLRKLFVLASGQEIAPTAWAVEASLRGESPSYWGRPWSAGREATVVVAFVPPDVRPKFLGAMGSMGLALRTFLLGTDHDQLEDESKADDELHITGVGYGKQAAVIPFAPSVAHRDLHRHVEKQKRLLESRNIRSDRLLDMHRRSAEELKLAEEALKAKDYPAWLDHSLSGRALALRAYMDAASTKKDTVMGVLFFMVVLVPFSFFAERLLFGFADPVRQILACGALFVLSFVALWLVHPGFQIARSTMVVLLGFVTCVLSLAVIQLGFNKFDYLMRFVTVPEVAAHTMDISRTGALVSACFVSVGNMRRSRIRTVLTLLTVTVMTFCVLSFTSIKTTLRPDAMPLDGQASYDGIMLTLNPDQGESESGNQWVFDQFAQRFEPGKVSLRCHVSFAQLWDDAGFGPPAPAGITRMVGIMPEDAKRTGLNKTLAHWKDSSTGQEKVLGRWLDPQNTWEVLLPLSSIRPDSLHQRAPEFTPEDFFDGETHEVRIKGATFTVVGIFDDRKADQIHDPNGEPCSPASNLLISSSRVRTVTSDTEDPSSRMPVLYEHVRWKTVALANYRAALSLDAGIKQIIIGRDTTTKHANGDELEELARRITRETALDVFLARDGRASYWRAVPLLGPQGLGNILLPLALGSLIIFNTLLGSVQDRVSEIGIYNALGLAPPHIAGMFLSEAGVYAVLGSVLGYLTGQGVLAVLNAADWLSGLSLNYSSSSALMTMGFMIASIMLSAVYPMHMVKRLCTAGAESTWDMPPAREGQIHVELPFTVDHETAEGLFHFIAEYVAGHREASLGTGFIVDQLNLTDDKDETGNPRFDLEFAVRLAPYDMGVVQQVKLSFAYVASLEMYAIHIGVHHRSGTDWLWYRKNKEFIDTIRRQLLLWHSLEPEVRTRYGAGGEGVGQTLNETSLIESKP